MKNTWQLQEAKAKFSEVVKEAVEHGPQIITKHGIETALIISIDDYKKANTNEIKLSTFFQQSPLHNVEIEFDRDKDLPRDIKL